MRALLSALILFSWSPMPYDCTGQPDSIVGFVARGAQIRIVRVDTCRLEDGTLYACPVYGVTPWVDLASLVANSWDWPAPDVRMGEAALLDVEQVDAAGNVSGGACP